MHGYNRAGYANREPWFEVFDRWDPRSQQFWQLLESYARKFYPQAVERELEILARRFKP